MGLGSRASGAWVVVKVEGNASLERSKALVFRGVDLGLAEDSWGLHVVVEP